MVLELKESMQLSFKAFYSTQFFLIQAITASRDPRQRSSTLPNNTNSPWQKPYMCVSENRGTPKSSILNRIFHYKPSILRHPYFWKHPYGGCLISSLEYLEWQIAGWFPKTSAGRCRGLDWHLSVAPGEEIWSALQWQHLHLLQWEVCPKKADFSWKHLDTVKDSEIVCWKKRRNANEYKMNTKMQNTGN